MLDKTRPVWYRLTGAGAWCGSVMPNASARAGSSVKILILNI
jgi:hypothetical protein